MNDYEEFKKRFKLLASKNKHLIINTLSNIFTMRLIGNKTHGDLAEIGIVEFINQFMYDFTSEHVGKDRFRAKDYEEDIVIINEITKTEFSVSLKAYGYGPLQLSTDKNQKLFSFLNQKKREKSITNKTHINDIFNSVEFKDYGMINIMPLIYKEKEKKCNIMVFNYPKAIKETKCISFIQKNETFSKGKIIKRKGRKHPLFLFTDSNGNYICEVRYGDASSNALQRGLWTNTKHAASYFDSLTNGWIDYSHNETLVKLFRLALNSTRQAHELVNKSLQEDIESLKEAR